MPPCAKILFLDDDPRRAAIFLERHPQAVWVATVPDCIAQLTAEWDEIHLDHDLGGETYVDHSRADCGTAVVRWLADHPQPQLRDGRTRFIVHSHNTIAADVMLMHLEVLGYQVRAQPFGRDVASESAARTNQVHSYLGRWLRRLAGLGPPPPRG